MFQPGKIIFKVWLFKNYEDLIIHSQRIQQPKHCASTNYNKDEDNSKKNHTKKSRYPSQTITDADYTDDMVLLANTPAQAKTLLHSLKWVAAGIGLHVNAHKMEYMCFNLGGNISTQNGSSLKLVDKFIYLGSSVSSTKMDINTQLAKA